MKWKIKEPNIIQKIKKHGEAGCKKTKPLSNMFGLSFLKKIVAKLELLTIKLWRKLYALAGLTVNQTSVTMKAIFCLLHPANPKAPGVL